MKRRLAFLAISLCVALVPATFIFFHPEPAHTRDGNPARPDLPAVVAWPSRQTRGQIDPALEEVLQGGQPGERFRFIIHLQDKFDLTAQQLPLSLQARRSALVSLLQQRAARSQAQLLNLLAGMKAGGEIAEYRAFWIINAVAASGTAEAIQRLRSLPEVGQIRLDERHRYFDPPTASINLEAFQETDDSSSSAWGVERIGAPQVWAGLGIDGEGVTVAIMDSGVDWLHPDLNANYRGNLGGLGVDHRGNWYSPGIPTATAPIDQLGHGTHVAGTAVGQNGIGVAPGSQWIAVAIADKNGLIYDSDVHSGFQWLLAPDGDPALAPDLINASWGGSPDATAFAGDVSALHAAGIITVFAAGNGGPFPGSITSPASYTDTLAVGASDDIDAVAWFSSRGPSRLTHEQKPWMVAPGTRILSALPGGLYGLSSGTSMAAPHVTGAIALLKSADATLTRQQIMGILADSAVPIMDSHPNDESGWGRLNAYAATWPQTQTGVLAGVVRGNGLPLPNTTVTITNASGQNIVQVTDADGEYQIHLRPGSYGMFAANFAFAPVSVTGIALTANQTTTHDLNLTALPSGVVKGVVRQGITGNPLSATISIDDTPIKAETDANGYYTVTLPTNRYDVVANAHGHRLGRASVTVTSPRTFIQDFDLEPSPAILLVDGGQWYYDSYIEYFQAGLADSGYHHDLWVIRNHFEDVPTAADLSPYDIVVWSSPYDSPGYVSANDTITGFLELGGDLLVSGQNVGNLDGYGFGSQKWWHRDLEATYLGKTSVSQTITGALGTLFEGITLTLNGGDSANNQLAVDQAMPRQGSLTDVILRYHNDAPAGLQAGHCDPFHLLYLGFGLEGVTKAADRAALLDRSIDFFGLPPLVTGVQWQQESYDDFALPGSQLVYTLTLRNLSQTMTDTFRLGISTDLWPTSLVTTTLTLGKCEPGRTILKVDVPADAPSDFVHDLRLTATSGNDANVTASLQLRHKTPGHILLVDDDRWYDQEATFQAALDAMNLSYDVWDIGWDEGVRGSPSTDFLNAYDLVVWFTGYDWYAPVTPKENEALTRYVAQGGRLFLNSQDFLFYNHDTFLAQNYLGVVEYRESITPTQIFGGDHPVLPSGLAGPLPLSYGAYRNFSDGLVPKYGSQPFIWHDQGMVAGIATAGPTWRALFWSFPFEALPVNSQASAMSAAIGWLSDLGDSTMSVDRRTGAPGEPRTYTITVRNSESGLSNHVWVTNSLPSQLVLLPSTISGGATYDAIAGQLTWQGELGPGAVHAISYKAVPLVGVIDDTRVNNPVRFGYQRHGLAFDREATLWVNGPDLSGSTLSAHVGPPAPVQVVTYTLLMRNSGLAAAGNISTVVTLPGELSPLTSTLAFGNGLAQLKDQHIFWQGHLEPAEAVTISLALTRPIAVSPLRLPATAIIADGVTDLIVRYTQPLLRPYELHFPFFPVTNTGS